VFHRGGSGGEGGKKHPKGFSFLLFSSRFSGHEKKRLPPTVDCQKSMHLSSSATKANNLRFVIVSLVVICYLLFLICCLLPPLQPSLSQIGLTYCCLCLNFCLHPKTVGIIKLVSVWGSTQVGINNNFF